jgi:hypothetical protein
MADTGPKAPTVATTTNESPWLDEPWVNPGNIYGAGEASVTAATFDNGDQTAVLKAYGFDFSAIPDGSIIDGVLVSINARSDHATLVKFDLVQLLDASRAKVGTNLAATPVIIVIAAADYSFGAADNKWGNALDSAWVKDPDFGVAIGVVAQTNNSQVWIDSVVMTVYYHSPPVDKTLADSGSGADAMFVAQTVAAPLSDTGAGADLIDALQSALAISESAGAGADIISVMNAALSFAEIGSGEDFLVLVQTLSVALDDSGSGVDAMTEEHTENVMKGLQDSGSGAEIVLLANVLVAGDAGSGIDEQAVLVNLLM